MTEREEPAGPYRVPGGDLGAVPLPWILAILLRERRVILVAVAVGFALSVLVALLRPPYYSSTFSFIPSSGQDQGRSGLASLAGQFGISVGALGGQSTPPQLYADLLETREILGEVARDTVVGPDRRRIPVAELLGVHKGDPSVTFENTLRALREKVVSASVAARTSGVITVTSRTRSPQASLQIAQKLLSGLNRFNVETRKSQAGEERRFAEGRLDAAKSSLRVAEDRLQQFMQGNRQIGGSPQLSIQRDRLEREVTFQQQIVTGLAQQYEDARIREVRETPVISIIERPALPVLPDPRGRVIAVVLGTMLAFLLAVAFVIAHAGWDRQRSDDGVDPSYEELAGEWRNFRESFRRARVE